MRKRVTRAPVSTQTCNLSHPSNFDTVFKLYQTGPGIKVAALKLGLAVYHFHILRYSYPVYNVHTQYYLIYIMMIELHSSRVCYSAAEKSLLIVTGTCMLL